MQGPGEQRTWRNLSRRQKRHETGREPEVIGSPKCRIWLQTGCFTRNLPAMTFPLSKLTGFAFVAGLLVFAPAEQAFSQMSPTEKSQPVQDPSPAPSQALLQKVKQSAMEQRIAIKQTEIDRLKEDLDKSKKDLDETNKNLDATTALINTSNANMDKLAGARKKLVQQLEITDLQIEAETRNSEGLQRLSAAQSSQVDAINQRMAEIDARSSVRQSEVQLLTAGKPVPGEDNDEIADANLSKLRKTLASDETKTVSADAIAREAMKAASARLEVAQEAAERVKQVSDSIAQSNLEPIGEKTTGNAAAPEASPTPKLHKRIALPKATASPSIRSASPSPKPATKSALWPKQ